VAGAVVRSHRGWRIRLRRGRAKHSRRFKSTIPITAAVVLDPETSHSPPSGLLSSPCRPSHSRCHSGDDQLAMSERERESIANRPRFGSRTNDVTARSISSVSRAPVGLTSTPNAGTTAGLHPTVHRLWDCQDRVVLPPALGLPPGNFESHDLPSRVNAHDAGSHSR